MARSALVNPYRPRFSAEESASPARPADSCPDVRACVVDPYRWEPLRRFSAGHSRRGAVAEVNRSSRERYAGRRLAQAYGVEGSYDRVVAILGAADQLVGWCGLGRRHLCEEIVPLHPGAYIYAIATDGSHRGTRVRYEGVTMRPGSAVMLAALRQIELDWQGEMPYVWARVKSDNGPSHRMFDRHGFLNFPHPVLEWVRVRPAGLPPA